MGSCDAWYGSPDGRCRGFNHGDASMVMMKSSNGSPTSSSSQETDGTSTICEAKKCMCEDDMAQLIKTCVVSSFIENNLHPKLNSVVPIIAIDPENARISERCSYNQ